jgi:transcription elongation factor Elf1
MPEHKCPRCGETEKLVKEYGKRFGMVVCTNCSYHGDWYHFESSDVPRDNIKQFNELLDTVTADAIKAYAIGRDEPLEYWEKSHLEEFAKFLFAGLRTINPDDYK